QHLSVSHHICRPPPQQCLSYIFSSSRRRHTICYRYWSSDVCSSDLQPGLVELVLKEIQLDTPRLTIGRKPDNDLVIDNPAMSGQGRKSDVEGKGGRLWCWKWEEWRTGKLARCDSGVMQCGEWPR